MDWLLITLTALAVTVNVWSLAKATKQRNKPGMSRLQLYNLWTFSTIVWTWLIATGLFDVDFPIGVDAAALILCLVQLTIFVVCAIADLRSLSKDRPA